MPDCGTVGGYHAHHRRDETPCRACKDARNAYQRRREPNTQPRPYVTLNVIGGLDRSWKKDAACVGMHDLFFLDRGDPKKAREAKRVCRRCPVQAECLDYALQTNEQFGIWGGLTTRNRRRLRA